MHNINNLMLSMLLTGLLAAQPGFSQLSTATVGYDRYAATEMVGRDFAGSPRKGLTEIGCVELCSDTPGCLAAVFSAQAWATAPTSQTPQGTCWLKNKIDTAATKSAKDVVTYVKRPFDKFPDIYLAGYDFPGNPRKGYTEQTCAKLCDITPGCVAAVYVTEDLPPFNCPDCCYLKSRLGDDVDAKGMVTYIKRQFEKFSDTNMYGTYFGESPLKGYSERECINKCAVTAGCVGIVYGAQATATPSCPNCCWLYNKVMPESTYTGLATYVKRPFEKFANTEVAGGDIADNPREGLTEQGCVDLCAETADCVAVVYVTKPSAQSYCANCCYLKNGITAASNNFGVTTYTKTYLHSIWNINHEPAAAVGTY